MIIVNLFLFRITAILIKIICEAQILNLETFRIDIVHLVFLEGFSTFLIVLSPDVFAIRIPDL